MPQESRFCGACGMDATPLTATPPSAPAAASETSAASNASEASDATLEPPTATPPAAPAPTRAPARAPTAEERACAWCGAINPREAARCSSCDAAFPTPEGDEALERAAQARIKAMETELKQQRSGWWPFRSR